jgi:hypothetical protein
MNAQQDHCLASDFAVELALMATEPLLPSFYIPHMGSRANQLRL